MWGDVRCWDELSGIFYILMCIGVFDVFLMLKMLMLVNIKYMYLFKLFVCCMLMMCDGKMCFKCVFWDICV